MSDIKIEEKFSVVGYTWKRGRKLERYLVLKEREVKTLRKILKWMRDSVANRRGEIEK
jgi:hypothetical protein